MTLPHGACRVLEFSRWRMAAPDQTMVEIQVELSNL